jgi:hypothetical protein
LVLKTPRVFSIYERGGKPLPIPDAEIACLRRIVDSEYPLEPCDRPTLGDVVEIEGGGDIRGVLVEGGNECRVAIGFDVIGRTVVIRVPLDSLRHVDQLTPHWSLQFL